MKIIHSLHCAGATIICRCLGSMDGVQLLSEIHPDGAFCPIAQLREWYDIDIGGAAPASWDDKFFALQKAEEISPNIVIRDQAHRNFIGRPYCRPTNAYWAGKEEIAIVRHPLHQFFSIARKLYGGNNITITEWLTGYIAYTRACKRMARIKYEHFVAHPRRELVAACTALDVSFDWTWQYKYQRNQRITGDLSGGPIQARPAPVPEQLTKAFVDNPLYKEALEVAHYEEA